MRAALFLTSTLALWAVPVPVAPAQEARPAAESTRTATQPPLLSNVERVRQRLGGRRAPVYVIVVPAPAAPAASAAAPAPGERRYVRTADGRYAPIVPPISTAAPSQIVDVDRRSDLLADSLGLPVPGVASRPAFFPAPPSRLDAVPTAAPSAPEAGYGSVVEVERALFETGLFRAVGVNFEFGKSRLLGGADVLVDPVGDVLQRYPELRLEVAGHTDSVGGAARNQQLSEARAQTVVDYLAERWAIDPDRLVAAGYGESRPLVTNDNPTGRTLNRRVEFRVLAPE